MKLPERTNKIIEEMLLSPPDSHPMDILRSIVSYLGLCDPDGVDNSEFANFRKAVRIVAKVPVIVANTHRISNREQVIDPNPKLSFAANFLYMFRGTEPNGEEKEAIDRYMVLHADHGLNASTFSARVTASTRSDMYSAVTSAIGTLKGPLHGGASERVLGMLDDIPHLREVEAYIQGMLDDKKTYYGIWTSSISNRGSQN